MSFRFSVAVAAMIAALDLRMAGAIPAAEQVRKLATYSIQSNRIFVVGVSSGGAMAVQMQVAYSKTFRGRSNLCRAAILLRAERSWHGVDMLARHSRQPPKPVDVQRAVDDMPFPLRSGFVNSQRTRPGPMPRRRRVFRCRAWSLC